MAPTKNLANNVAYKFQYLARQYRAQFDAEVEPLGLTRSQWWILVNVFHFRGINQKQLAESLGINRSAVGSMVHKLEHKGWIVRTPSSRGSRAFNLELSPNIQHYLDQLFVLSETLIEESLAELTPEEVTALHSAMGKISTHIAENTPSTSETVERLRNHLMKTVHF